MQIKVESRSLTDVVVLVPEIFQDSRGFFIETFRADQFKDIGLPTEFLQDNHSRSSRGTLRGLHYQLPHAQAKLCRVIEGEVLDVAVDIRVGSPYFGKWASVLLSADKANMVYVPAGFAHGFVTLTESAQFLYKCSDVYAPKDEHGIIWNDPDLNIAWGINNPLVSEKDGRYTKLSEMPRHVLPRYSS